MYKKKNGLCLQVRVKIFLTEKLEIYELLH